MGPGQQKLQNNWIQRPPVVDSNCWSCCCNEGALRHQAIRVFFSDSSWARDRGDPEKGRPELVAGTLWDQMCTPKTNRCKKPKNYPYFRVLYLTIYSYHLKFFFLNSTSKTQSFEITVCEITKYLTPSPQNVSTRPAVACTWFATPLPNNFRFCPIRAAKRAFFAQLTVLPPLNTQGRTCSFKPNTLISANPSIGF